MILVLLELLVVGVGAGSRDATMSVLPSAGVKTTDAASHNTMCVTTTTISMDIGCGTGTSQLLLTLVVDSLQGQWERISVRGKDGRRRVMMERRMMTQLPLLSRPSATRQQ